MFALIDFMSNQHAIGHIATKIYVWLKKKVNNGTRKGVNVLKKTDLFNQRRNIIILSPYMNLHRSAFEVLLQHRMCLHTVIILK